jgi:MFS superfamily sulfate permease-like transporter
VVLFAVRGLISADELRHLRRVSGLEFKVAIVAVFGVLLFGILKGVMLAVIFSILLLLRLASRPRLAVLGRLPGTQRFVDVARYSEQQQLAGTVVLRLESGLFYFNAQNVKNGILGQVQSRPGTTTVILDLSSSPNIDLAGARMLRDLHEQLGDLGVSLRLAEVTGYVRDLLQAEGLQERIAGIARRTSVAQLLDERQVTTLSA